MCKKIQLQEMESDISALEKTIEDWNTGLKKFDDDWNKLVNIHNEQRATYVAQIQKDTELLAQLREKYLALKHNLIEDAYCESAERINEYYANCGCTPNLVAICSCVALKRDDTNLNEITTENGIEKFLNEVCDEEAYDVIASYLDLWNED